MSAAATNLSGDLSGGMSPDASRLTSPARDGSDAARLVAMWHANRRWVAAILLAYKPRWADVDDLLQDVALTVLGKGSELRDEGAFRPWLRTVAINAAHAAARAGRLREGRVGRVELDDAHVLARVGAGAELERALVDEQAQQVLDAARQLPEGYAEPLLLKTVQGMSYREIGQVLGLPESTIETRIARARRMVREIVHARGDGSANAAHPSV